LIPVTRTRLAALEQELTREAVRLEHQQRALGQLTVHVANGEQAIAEHRYQAAVRAFEQALAVAPECAAASQGLSRCRAAIAERDAEALRIKSLVREAQTAARAEDWEHTVRICDEILTIDRTVPLAIALREAGRSALEQARQQAAGNRLRDAAAGQIRLARARFRRGLFDEAISGLSAFLAIEPTALAAQVELNRLAAMAALRAQEAAKRAEEVDRHCNSARALLERNAVEGAVVAARHAVECDPADQASALLFCDAIEREGAVRIDNERRRMDALRKSAAEFVVGAAQLAIARGDLVRAMSAAENAIRLYPSSVEAKELLDRARTTLAADGPDDAHGDVELATQLPADESNVSTLKAQTASSRR
jgi:tetratricopeptide (TPR) repeat protein